MNTPEYTHDSLAHDFSMFLPKEQEPAEAPRRKPNIVKMPVRKQAAQKAAARHLAGKISSFLMAGLVVAMLCGSIYLRVEVNEVTDQINEAQSALEEQRSEETRLLMEIERKVSYKNIEEAAEELGMQKKERSQVDYITTNPDSKGEVVENGGSLSAEN